MLQGRTVDGVRCWARSVDGRARQRDNELTATNRRYALRSWATSPLLEMLHAPAAAVGTTWREALLRSVLCLRQLVGLRRQVRDPHALRQSKRRA